MSETDALKNEIINSPSLLVDRDQAALLMGVCHMTVRRVEEDGRLQPIYLRETWPTKTYYRKADVIAFAANGTGKTPQRKPRKKTAK